MKKTGYIFIFIGILFILLSFSFVLYNYYNDKNAEKESKEIYNKIDKSINENIKEVKEINIDGNNYIGILKIPKLSLELPIMSDWNYNKMKISPCRYYGNIYTNDLIICAHAYKSLFGRLNELNIDDLVVIIDTNNNYYYYEVKVIEIIQPNDVKKMIENNFDLTLYTCTSDNLNRLTIRLNRIY